MADPFEDLLAGHLLEAAPRLLGTVVSHDSTQGRVAVRLTEVEAYDGPDDPGSHAHRGRTARNAAMFGPPGHAYVYFTYGLHHCLNVVVGSVDLPAAVLLRGGEVVDGLPLARQRRGPRAWPDRDLARGPARLCQALGVDRGLDGHDLRVGALRLTVEGSAGDRPVGRVATGPRVGLRRAAERPWRFWLVDEPTVSTYRPASTTIRTPSG